MDRETITDNQRKVHGFNIRTELKCVGWGKGEVIKLSPRLLKTKAQFPAPPQIFCVVLSTSFVQINKHQALHPFL